jgi:hypothetical protein
VDDEIEALPIDLENEGMGEGLLAGLTRSMSRKA